MKFKKKDPRFDDINSKTSENDDFTSLVESRNVSTHRAFVDVDEIKKCLDALSKCDDLTATEMQEVENVKAVFGTLKLSKDFNELLAVFNAPRKAKAICNLFLPLDKSKSQSKMKK